MYQEEKMRSVFGVIYLITNIESGHKYVGQTTMRLSERWYEHKRAAKKWTIKVALYNAMNSYGIDKFECHKIAEAFSREELDILEQHYIRELNTLAPNGYNLTTGGYSFNHTEKTKQKLRELLTPDHPFRTAWLGRNHTDESKKLMSEAREGKPLSDKNLEGIIIGINRFYSDLRQDPEAYESYIAPRRDTSHLHTPEVEARSAQGKVGKHPKYTEERNEKISQTLREQGHKPSEECRQKAREARLGSKMSEESKKKISENRKGIHAYNRTVLTPEQEAIVLQMLSEHKRAKEISMVLFGEYKKAVIYRLLKEI